MRSKKSSVPSSNSFKRKLDEKIGYKKQMEKFIGYCQVFNYINLKEIFKPFSVMINDLLDSKEARNFLFILLSIFLIYLSTYLDFVSWSLAAIGRIIMIQLLPVFDWRYLAYEKCLIPLPYFSKIPERTSNNNIDCILCEGMDKIDVRYDIKGEDLMELYLTVHKPLIVGNAVDLWPNLANASDIKEFLKFDSVVHNSIPCQISTSVYYDICDVKKLMMRIEIFEKHFLQFQNCDLNVVKQLRIIIPRPSFLPVELAPIQYSWIFLSKKFELNVYKRVNFSDNIVIFVQVLGRIVLKFSPNEDCKLFCPQFKITLKSGEAVIFSNLWRIEYKPDPKSENMAFALETHEYFFK